VLGRLRAIGVALSWLACAPGALRAQAECQPESECRFKKPNVLVVLDYSSSMVGFEARPAYFPPGQTATTRWDATLDATSWILRYDDGFFARNTRLALARFAHDPEVGVPGTYLETDTSFPKITDGFAIDVPWNGSDGAYFECRGSGVEAEVEVLRGTPPPSIVPSLDPTAMMLTWTRGALDSAHALVRDTRESHTDDPGEADRNYEVVLMTDGDWTCPDMIGQACDENPAPAAAELRADGVRVHVVAFGDATMQPSLNEVALRGGTQAAIDATSPQGIVDALSSVLDEIRNSVIVPECTRGLPRVLVIMDGSSSMLAGSAPGETKWDMARFALAGNPEAPEPSDPGYVEPVFSRKIAVDGREVAIEDVVHLGLMAFARADEQQLLVNFGPCMRDNFAWAMDPRTSCEPPGCADPYAGYPLAWTFKNSDGDRDPPFVQSTRSFMPACNQTQGSTSCVGRIPNTFTGQGLEFARSVIDDYRRDPGRFAADASTRFVNVLISDGETSDGSSDVRPVLEGMAEAGIDTYVIGFGSTAELNEGQLDQYAAWGNTGSAIVVDPTAAQGAAALADALEGVVREIDVDACCVLNECALSPEPPPPAAVCGDGRVDEGEACDDGDRNATYGHCGGRCDGPHLFCGDSRTDTPEACDDGNTDDGDGCSAGCEIEGETDAGPNDFTGSGGVPPVPYVPEPKPARAGAAAPRPAPAADAGPDGGSAASPSDDGCSCRTAGAPRLPRSAAGLALLAFAAAVLRPRRRRYRRRGGPPPVGPGSRLTCRPRGSRPAAAPGAAARGIHSRPRSRRTRSGRPRTPGTTRSR
jgi:MYXO-CTERM domain-containing protein